MCAAVEGPADTELQMTFVPVRGDVDSVVPALDRVPARTRERWRRTGSSQVPTLVCAYRAGLLEGVAFETHRAMAGYRKIVDLWAVDRATADALVRAIEQRAWDDGAIAVKREFDTMDAEWDRSSERGYRVVPEPASPAVVGHRRPAQVRWRDRNPARDLAYMRQTTGFTCGPVAVQMALCALGLLDTPSPELEIAMWRQATMVLGCDPFGLALVAAQYGAVPEVYLSTTDAVMLELFDSGQERELRRSIQVDFRRRAIELGIAVHTCTFDMATLRAALADGAIAVVLIDQKLMHPQGGEHWLTVHDVVGDTFVCHDPWTTTEDGETSLDGADLPLPAATLDRVAWFDRPAHRCMVVLRNPSAR